MKTVVEFFKILIGKIINDEIFIIANEMTYKILLSLFPFIIFLISILSFLNLDDNALISFLQQNLPEQIVDILLDFIIMIKLQTGAVITPASLLVAVFSAQSGFQAIIRGINKSFGVKNSRKIVRTIALSVLLVLIFEFTIVLTLTLLILGAKFKSTILSGLIFLFIMFTVMVIYKLSLDQDIALSKTFPGALCCMVLWILSTYGFNIYIKNFSKMGAVYGAIGGIFIMLIWINILSLILLLGSEINGSLLLLEKKELSNKTLE